MSVDTLPLTIRSFNMSGGKDMSRNRFKLCLKINNTKCMAKLHAGKRQKVRAVFSDLVLNAQFFEQINDRYSKN